MSKQNGDHVTPRFDHVTLKEVKKTIQLCWAWRWDAPNIHKMLKVCPTKSLIFDELIPGNNVRVTEDNMIYAVDLTMVITEKNRNEAGKFFVCFLNQALIKQYCLTDAF